MTTYKIEAGQYAETLRACGIALTGWELVPEALDAIAKIVRLDLDEMVCVDAPGDHGDDVYVYRSQEAADRDQDGSRAVVVLRAEAS